MYVSGKVQRDLPPTIADIERAEPDLEELNRRDRLRKENGNGGLEQAIAGSDQELDRGSGKDA
jgi:hypothetical protein